MTSSPVLKTWLIRSSFQQVENEYGNVLGAYGIGGELYVKWAAETAVTLNTSVPWVMCQQSDAPDPIVCIFLLVAKSRMAHKLIILMFDY